MHKMIHHARNTQHTTYVQEEEHGHDIDTALYTDIYVKYILF